MTEPAPDRTRSADGLGRPAPSPRRELSVLVVDDSAIVRRLVHDVVSGAPGFRVVGEAADGDAAVRAAAVLRPDVIILDLEMPVMGGMEALRRIRSTRPDVRVVVFANVVPEDLGRVTKAIRRHRAELVVKPTGVSGYRAAMSQVRQQLLPQLSGRDPGNPETSAPGRQTGRRDGDPVNAVIITSSTGGPQALERVFGGMGRLPVPVFVVQHISVGFSHRLAGRLDRVSRCTVVEAADGVHPEAGHAYLAPGGRHLTVERDGARPVLRLTDDPPVNSCRPAADVLLRSSAEVYGGRQLIVVLTGIGEDGLAGCRELSPRGALVLVQDEASSVVWGMPGAVARAGLADEILPIDELAGRIERLTVLRGPKAGPEEDRS